VPHAWARLTIRSSGPLRASCGILMRLAVTTLELERFEMSDAKTEASLSESKGRVTGIGGVLFKAKDNKALAAWYRDILGVPVQSWGGAVFHLDEAGRPPAVAWNAFAETTDHFSPSSSAFMINYVVDDMDALLDRAKAAGVVVLKLDDQDTYGRFAWILDPEGNKVELWEPKR
jgi:predicted enzyme related to lactoylglutathione lyase